jgi:hypothetical protein
MKTIKIAVSGTSSEVGKTTLLCQLLREFPGWEAIKVTRGHYRSCGKDPHACCVSHLLTNEPLVRSGFRQTFADNKDTGRYWDAGAANVHWLIVTDDQIERGIHLALERVNAPGVLIEGNSFLKFLDVDFAILVAAHADTSTTPRIKSSTRWAYQKATALYTLGPSSDVMAQLQNRYPNVNVELSRSAYTSASFGELLFAISALSAQRSGDVPHS